MEVAELYDRIAARLPEDFESNPKRVVGEVMGALADRLSPDAAAELGAELPEEIGDHLLHAHGDGSDIDRDELIEDLAARLDVDDAAAESAAEAVLVSLREYLEAVVPIDQMLSSLPSEIAHMMQP